MYPGRSNGRLTLRWAPPELGANNKGLNPWAYDVAANGTWQRYEILPNDDRIPLTSPGQSGPIRGVLLSGEVADPDNHRDVLVESPNTIERDGGLFLEGIRHCKWIGAHIRQDQLYVNGGVMPEPLSGTGYNFVERQRALRLKAASGIWHLERILIDGDNLFEGINASSVFPSSVMQFQRLRIERTRWYQPSATVGAHDGGDAFHIWDGPGKMRMGVSSLVDCDYQGIYLEPTDHSDGGTTLPRVTLENVNLSSSATPTGYRGLLYQGDFVEGATRFPLRLRQVYVEPRNGQTLAETVRASTGGFSGQLTETVTSKYVEWDPAARITGRVHLGPPAKGDFCKASELTIPTSRYLT